MILKTLVDDVVRVTVAEVMIGLVFFQAERFRPSIVDQYRIRRGMFVDLGFVYVAMTIAFVFTAVGFTSFVDHLGDAGTLGTLGRIQRATAAIPLPLQFVMAIVVSDFFGYWKHRLMHVRLLWPVHAIHHSSEEVDWLSNERIHPVEFVLTSLFHTVPLVLLGMPTAIVLWAGQIRRFHSLYEHANLELGYGNLHRLFVSPMLHRWHHVRDEKLAGKNYANVFSFFDWIFGTLYLPTKSPEKGSFGLAQPIADDFKGQLCAPFTAIFRRDRKTAG
ncbi:hypothetical protein BH09MYX1_BH09MYX1_14270 [soil metagenome]